MKLKKIEIVRAMGIFLIASSSVLSSFACVAFGAGVNGRVNCSPSDDDSKKPYCLQDAQVNGLLKSFKVNKKQLMLIVKKGGAKECFEATNADGTGACQQWASLGVLITGPAQCSELLESSVRQLNDKIIEKYDKTNALKEAVGERRLAFNKRNEHANFSKLALAGTKNSISCKEVKSLLQKILATPMPSSTVKEPLGERIGEEMNELPPLPVGAPSSKTIVKNMCGGGKPAPKGMTSSQKKKLRASVAAALPSKGVFNKSNSDSIGEGIEVWVGNSTNGSGSTALYLYPEPLVKPATPNDRARLNAINKPTTSVPSAPSTLLSPRKIDVMNSMDLANRLETKAIILKNYAVSTSMDLANRLEAETVLWKNRAIAAWDSFTSHLSERPSAGQSRSFDDNDTSPIKPQAFSKKIIWKGLDFSSKDKKKHVKSKRLKRGVSKTAKTKHIKKGVPTDRTIYMDPMDIVGSKNPAPAPTHKLPASVQAFLDALKNIPTP
jgi:hypothetical protein